MFLQVDYSLKTKYNYDLANELTLTKSTGCLRSEKLRLKNQDFLHWLFILLSAKRSLKGLCHLDSIRAEVMTISYICQNFIIIGCKRFFLFIGREPTTWPANNCLQIMVCSCAMSFNCFWLQILFCSCVNETTLAPCSFMWSLSLLLEGSAR